MGSSCQTQCVGGLLRVEKALAKPGCGPLVGFLDTGHGWEDTEPHCDDLRPDLLRVVIPCFLALLFAMTMRQCKTFMACDKK